MNREPNHHEPELAPREQQALSHALGELTSPKCDALGESLSGDPAAKRACAEMKVIADALRDVHAATPLPPASPELCASIDKQLITAQSEDLVVTISPKTIAPRRRFSRLEVILSIGLLCVGALVVLLATRESGRRELADIGTAIVSLDHTYTSQAANEQTTPSPSYMIDDAQFHAPGNKYALDDSESMSASNRELDQRRIPNGSLLLKNHDAAQLRYSGTIDAASSVSTASDSPPITYPDRQEWEELTLRRKKYPSADPSRVTVGLDPTDSPTADYDVEFHENEFRAVIPTAGGFDAQRGLGLGWLGGKGKFEEGRGGDQHARIYENAFKTVSQDPLSTFSIDVDTASYSKMRQHILQHGQLPPPDAVRIEELINYFPYDYLEPMDEHPFAAHMEVAQCPWQAEHRLARIAIKGKEMQTDERPASNLVFLVDVSGSMNEANKLPLVVRGLEMLTRELNENDRVAIVVYAGAAGLVLPSTSGDEKETILAALGKLESGGSTAGAEGINLAYKTAEENFIHAGVNRVILCSDGDFNVGVSDTGSLVRLAEEQAKKNIFLSILGFGIGNLNDEMLEQVSDKANGMYAFIDTENEARKVLVEQMSGTLVTIAKDVKIQIEFNPAKVAAYRLIGYENRILAAEDFNNDKKDAGEIGAGHTVTALYEIVPVVAKEKPEIPAVDELKYQRPSELTDAAESDELLTLKLRYKSPEGEKSTLLSEPIDDSTVAFGKVSDDFKFAAAVASFGMLLRGSEYAGDATLDAVLEIATDGAKHDEWGYRKEFLEIVKRAKELKK